MITRDHFLEADFVMDYEASDPLFYVRDAGLEAFRNTLLHEQLRVEEETFLEKKVEIGTLATAPPAVDLALVHLMAEGGLSVMQVRTLYSTETPPLIGQFRTNHYRRARGTSTTPLIVRGTLDAPPDGANPTNWPSNGSWLYRDIYTAWDGVKFRRAGSYNVNVWGNAAENDIQPHYRWGMTDPLLDDSAAEIWLMELRPDGLWVLGNQIADSSGVIGGGGSLPSDAQGVLLNDGAGALTWEAVTAFGLSLLDDANAAAGRTTLGLGTMAEQAANNVAITGGTATLSGLTTSGSGLGWTAIRTSSATNSIAGISQVRHQTSGDMVDGFGVSHSLAIRDDTSGTVTIAEIGAVRDGADNTGKVVLRQATAGTMATRAELAGSGLHVIGDITATGTIGGGGGAGSVTQLRVNTLANNTTSTSETSLSLYAVPGGTLANVQDRLEIEALVRLEAEEGEDVTARLKWGTQVICEVSDPTGSGAKDIFAILRGTIIRTGATTQSISGWVIGQDGVSKAFQVAGTQTLSSSVNLTVTGQVTATNGTANRVSYRHSTITKHAAP